VEVFVIFEKFKELVKSQNQDLGFRLKT